MKLKHLAWMVGILGAFVVWLGMELFAVLDHRAWTEPFTDIVVGFLPAGVGIPTVIGFSLWLMIHFVSRWLDHPVLAVLPKGYSKYSWYRAGWDDGLKQHDSQHVAPRDEQA